MRKHNSGFSVVELVIIILVAAVVTTIGWFVYNKTQSEQAKPASQTQTSAATAKSATASGADVATEIQYVAPTSWKGTITAEKYAVDEKIHVGYGAPVYVRYSSSSNTWQTLEDDAVRSENSVVMSDLKVENKYSAASYTTGDGFGAQLRVLVVRDKTVYQLLLPATCESSSECGDSYTTHTIQGMKNDLPNFIRSINFTTDN